MIDEDWHRLDNTGKIYPLIRSFQQSTLFRLTAIISEPVDPEKLKDAVKKVVPLFPYFQVTLKPGFFWYYFEKTNKLPAVREDWNYPCTRYERRWSVSPIYIYYKNNYIALEILHSLTDGYGGTVFLKALLNSYFGLDRENLPISKSADSNKENIWEDAYNKYYNPAIPPSKKGPKAFHLPFPRVMPGIYYSTTGIMPLEEILSTAKSDGCSLTQWLSGLYLDVLTKMIQDHHWKPLPVVLNVPVDLRKLFPSKTLKNFFVTLTPCIDSRLGHFSFDEILTHVKNFMEIKVDHRYISQQFKRNINFERSMTIRLIPLLIKRIFFPFFYYYLGERQYSGGFSNLGRFTLSPELREKVKEIHILPPPSPGTLIKAGCISYNNKLFITFGSLTENRELERRFFTSIRKKGIPVRIDTNY